MRLFCTTSDGVKGVGGIIKIPESSSWKFRTFPFRQRRLVAIIARYHRRSLPSKDHSSYDRLGEDEKKMVCALGGILRIADGLDCSHLGLVEDLSCTLEGEDVQITCLAGQPPQGEDRSVMRKKNLFEKHFRRKVSLSWVLQE